MAFDTAAYVRDMTAHIEERCALGSRLYLEVGGHLVFDSHASRVLPGFAPSAKLAFLRLLPLRKTALALIEALRDAVGVAAVVVTRCDPVIGPALRAFAARVAARFQVAVHFHGHTEGYPEPAAALAGFARNSAVVLPPDVRLVLVSGVQANSGKLATCLSQLHHERTALYSKLELFPLHDLPPRHPVNLAYEAATADVGDVVLPDPFAPGSTNYDRDIAAFPLLRRLMEALVPDSPLLARLYSSPTAMGVNCARAAIRDEPACVAAAKREIARRRLLFAEVGDAAAGARVERLLRELGETVESLLPAARRPNSLCLDGGEHAAALPAAWGRLSAAAALVCGGDDEAAAAADARVNYDWAAEAFGELYCSRRSFRRVSCAHLTAVDWSRFRRAHFHLAERPDEEERAFLTLQVGAFVTVAGGASAATERNESRVAQLTRLWGLTELPEEGCLFAATERTERCSNMLGLLVGEEAVSRFHRLSVDEVWHWYEGAPLRLVLLLADGSHEERVLSAAGPRQALVPAGAWMAAHSLGSHSAFGCTCAPPWEQRHFEAGTFEALAARYPACREDIRRFQALPAAAAAAE